MFYLRTVDEKELSYSPKKEKVLKAKKILLEKSKKYSEKDLLIFEDNKDITEESYNDFFNYSYITFLLSENKIIDYKTDRDKQEKEFPSLKAKYKEVAKRKIIFYSETDKVQKVKEIKNSLGMSKEKVIFINFVEDINEIFEYNTLLLQEKAKVEFLKKYENVFNKKIKYFGEEDKKEKIEKFKESKRKLIKTLRYILIDKETLEVEIFKTKEEYLKVLEEKVRDNFSLLKVGTDTLEEKIKKEKDRLFNERKKDLLSLKNIFSISKKELKKKTLKDFIEEVKDAVFSDAGIEDDTFWFRVTDFEGKSLLEKIFEKETIENDKVFLKGINDISVAEGIGFYFALTLAINEKKKKVFIDSQTALSFNTQDKELNKKLLELVNFFEGSVSWISGGLNPADDGTHLY